MTDYIGNYKNRPRRVVFYGRVSTEHEEQLSALGNQMEWYTDLALRNPNWTVVAQYIDEGISAAPKRPKMPIAGIATIGTSIARPNFDRFVIKAFHSFFILLPPIGTSRCTTFAVGQQNYPQ